MLSKGVNSPDNSKESTHEKRIQCFNCKGYGHKASECRKPARQEPRAEKRCFLCDRSGHYARDWKVAGSKNGPIKAGAAQHGSSAFSGVGPELESCIQNNELLLANGTKLPIVKSGGSVTASLGKNKMPVVKGLVGNTAVETLRDTGCSGVVIRKQFVKEDQYTGKYCYILLIDNTVRQVPIVKIQVDTPYLKGEVEAQRLPDALYDLIIGNVEGARAPDDPDTEWHETCAVTTRSQAKRSDKLKALKTPEVLNGLSVGKEDLRKIQEEDPTLEKYRNVTDTKTKGDQEITFKTKDGVLYRSYKSSSGKTLQQVMVPQPLRERVMDVVHSSVMGGHMGIQKATDKITSNFY